MVALKQLRSGKFEIQREDQIEMKNLRDLNNDHMVSGMRKGGIWQENILKSRGISVP